MKTKRNDIRNAAIVAHVDHAKTTLVDDVFEGAMPQTKFVLRKAPDLKYVFFSHKLKTGIVCRTANEYALRKQPCALLPRKKSMQEICML